MRKSAKIGYDKRIFYSIERLMDSCYILWDGATVADKLVRLDPIKSS